uniref:Agenet domain-containing protein n=1 Tax=Brassica oleracea var. oleracea TaxID=109376 RepID=A0A0D3A820_BRAOL
MKNLKKKGKLLSIAKSCEVEVSLQEDGFKGSWFRAMLEQNPTRVKGEKLRVCYKTLLHEDGVNPCKETIERCFIRPVLPKCLNEGVVFKEGSVVDAYFNNGWWTGVIIVERPDGSFLVYFDDPLDIMRFIRSQLRPHADWIGSEWVKSKNKVLSQHMFRTGKLVEMTREISEKYSLNDFVEVVVTHGWRKGRVTEILIENNYKVYFDATKKDAVFNYTEIRLSMEWLGGGSWIRARKGFSHTKVVFNFGVIKNLPTPFFQREFGNNAATPIRSAQESPSNTLVLESNEDVTVNDDATEITSSQESHSNTSVLEATETEKQNHETIDVVELPLPHESYDMMDDVATPIIDPQDIPRGETMSIYDDKIALPKRISEPGTNGGVLDRINKRSNLKLVDTVENVLDRKFKKLEDSFLAPGLWFSFGEQLMRFSLREFHLETGLPFVVDKDEEEVETSATKNKKEDPWMKKNQTLNTLLNLLVKKSTKLSADQRLWLGATILVEGILMASNPVTSIPEERLLREVESFAYKKLTEKDQYAICGFIYPLQLWALSSVNQLGTFFGIRDDEIQFPLCLHWIETKSLTIEEVNRFDKMEKVDVKCILGDPELHSDLVEDVDSEFGRVVDLVKRGYRLKRQDWLNGSVDIVVAEAEVDENNSAPGIDATDQEKIEFLTKKVVSLEKKMKYLEGFLNIRGEILKGKKKGIRPPGEVDHQVEDDTEVEHGAKESDTTKVNEDGEVNKDASKKPMKVTKKRGRGNKGKKKSVKPPREVQQQVEDDAEIGAKESENPKTNEDGEVNEDASKKPVKFTKKRERGNKLNISVYNGL